MKMNIRKLLPLILIAALSLSVSAMAAVQPAHAAGTLYTLPAHQANLPQKSTFTIKIQVANIDPFNAWDISVQTDPTVIKPLSLTEAGNLLAVNFTTTVFPLINCINGIGTGCIATDGPGIAHSAVTGFGPPPQVGASSGLLFTITYNVTTTNLSAFSSIHFLSQVIANGATGLQVPVTVVDGSYGIAPNIPPTASFTVTGNNTVTGSTVSFNAAASVDPDGSITAYAWTFGDGGTGTGVAPTHVYATAGTFTVTLTVTDNGGATGKASAKVGVVDRPPTASFTVTGNNTLTGSTVSFNAGGSTDPDGTISTYAWTFGDGMSGTGVTTTHSYATAGTYTVTLTVTDNSGSIGTKSVKVGVVDRPPVASFTVTGNNTLTGSTVSFNAGGSTDPDGTISTYAWTFGDGGSATGVTTTHMYATAGTFTVTLTVTDNSGSIGTKSVKVGVVDRPPVASFTVTGNNTLTGSTVSFDASASADPDGTISTYAWTFGDGMSGTGVTTTHSYATAGTYTVTLTVTDNSGSKGTSTAKVGVVDRPPTASFTVTGNNTVTGSTVSFNAGASTDPDGTISTYAWTFGDGMSGTGVTTTHSYATAGTYTVTLTVTDNSGSTGSTSAKVGVVDRPPVASFTVTGNNTLTGSTVSFDASASADPDGTITTYAWTFGDGMSGTGVTTTHSYAIAGTYTVTLTVTDNSGSTGTTSTKVGVVDRPPVASFTVTGNNTLTGSTVSFDASASADPDGTITTYAWTFGDGMSGTGVTTTHSYATAGTYTVTLTVTDNSANTGTKSVKVGVVDRPPVASFTVTGNNTIAGSTVSFNAGASSDPDGTITTYAWTFGDGMSSTGVTTTHIYANGGTFTVTLTVTDNSGSTGSTTAKVGVIAKDIPPIASFTVTGNNTVTGSTVSFNAAASVDPDGTIVSYAWTFGDGMSGTGVTTTHSYATAGTYTVTLTVTDNSGSVGSTSTKVGVVDRPPVASFTVTGNNTLTGSTVAFDASASADPDGTITAYSWTFGDGMSGTGVTTTHSYATAGTYTVTLTVTDNSGSKGSTTAKVGVVDRPPVASFTVTGNNTAAGSTVSFNAAASSDPDGSIVSYAWTFGDGMSGTGVMTTHVYAAMGTYTVTLTVTDNSGSTGTSSTKVGVTPAVNIPPIASFTVTGNNTLTGSTVSFNAAASVDPDGTIVSYAWTFGDGMSGTGVTTTHSYATAGTYTVTLTVTDNGGLTGTASSKVGVLDRPPTASFTVTGNNTLTGSTVSFDASASADPDGTITTYSWMFGDGASGTGKTITHSYTTAGTYTVTLTVTDNSGSTGSATAKIGVVDRPPTASFTVTGNNTLTGSTVTFDAGASADPDGTITSYAWTFGDGTSGTGVMVTHAYATAGTYTVTLTVTDNSGSTGSATAKVGVVDRPPTASFTVTGNNTISGSTVSFDASASSDPDGTIVTYAWSFGDGMTGSGKTTTHIYALSGTFTVTLTVTDNSANSATASAKVTALDKPPIAKFTVTGNNTIAPATMSFDASGSFDPDGTIASYSWSFGDGTTGTGVTVNHTYAAGTFTVTLTVTDNSGSTGTASAVVVAVVGPHFVHGKLSWTHHLSLAKNTAGQTFTAHVRDDAPSPEYVLIRITGSSSAGIFTAMSAPTLIQPGVVTDVTFSQAISTSFISTKICFTATLYWGNTAATVLTNLSSITKSGCFAVVP